MFEKLFDWFLRTTAGFWGGMHPEQDVRLAPPVVALVDLDDDPEAYRNLKVGQRVMVGGMECLVEECNLKEPYFLTTAASAHRAEMFDRPDDFDAPYLWRHVRVGDMAIVPVDTMVEALRQGTYEIA